MKRKYLILIILGLLLSACGEDTSTPDASMEQSNEEISVTFRGLDIKAEDTSFVLTGEVNAADDIFYYLVKQGEEELLAEQSVELASGEEWVSFEITEELPEETLDGEEAPIITMYGKTADNQTINPNFIPVDIGIR